MGSYGRRNHSCTISAQSVQGLGSYGNPKFPISYTQRSWPLQQLALPCYTVMEWRCTDVLCCSDCVVSKRLLMSTFTTSSLLASFTRSSLVSHTLSVTHSTLSTVSELTYNVSPIRMHAVIGVCHVTRCRGCTPCVDLWCYVTQCRASCLCAWTANVRYSSIRSESLAVANAVVERLSGNIVYQYYFLLYTCTCIYYIEKLYTVYLKLYKPKL